MKHCKRRLCLAVAALCASAAHMPAAWAQIAADATLPEVSISASAEKETATSPVVGYRARQAMSGTKTDTALAETPQSVTVVTQDQMVDQGAASFQGALLYAAGVRSDAYGLDSRSDNVAVRGSAPDIYLDGLRQNYNWYTSTTPVEPYALERMEVLRGPAGMLFGAGTVAGVVNMASKRPLGQRHGELGVQMGTWGRKQLQADVGGVLDESGQWSWRLVGLWRKSATQVDYVPDDRGMLAPSLLWRPNAATSLLLQGYWQHDQTGSVAQFMPWVGMLLPSPNGQVPLQRFIGEPGDYYNSRRASLGWQLEHKINADWTLRQNLRISRNKNRGGYHYADFWTVVGGWGADPVGQRMIGRLYGRNINRTRMAAVDTHAQGRFAAGGLGHTLLAGVDWNRQAENKTEAPDTENRPINAYAPVYGSRISVPMVDKPRDVQRQMGFYVQDQIAWGPWRVVAGLRHDRVVNGQDGVGAERSSATTKRLGVMYRLAGGWTPYLSYAESFSPVAGTNAYGQRFRPLKGKQLEAGVKFMPDAGAASFTASVYRLKEQNQLVNDPTNPSNRLQAGQTRNKGVELEFKARPTPSLEVLAHYNYVDVDDTLGGQPPHQAAVWARQGFSVGGMPGFSVGLGWRYMSAFHDGSGPRVPAAGVADAMLAHESRHWRYALNISNLADKQYMSICLARGDCWWAERRKVTLSATWRF